MTQDHVGTVCLFPLNDTGANPEPKKVEFRSVPNLFLEESEHQAPLLSQVEVVEHTDQLRVDYSIHKVREANIAVRNTRSPH